MKRLPVIAMSLCALCLATSAEASPPSWAPSAVSHVVEARCEAMVASLGFTILTGSQGQGAFRLDAVSVKVNEEADGTRNPALPPLPAAIAAIDRPFLDRVVPTCTDNGISFVVYLASEAQVTRPGHSVTGAAKRLYVDVSRDAKANIYAAEPDAPMAR
jgi:hypothetical protein